MVCSSASQEVRDESSGLCNPLLVARLCLESVDRLWVLVVVRSVSASIRGDGVGVISFGGGITAAACVFAIEPRGRITVRHRDFGQHLCDVDSVVETHTLGQTWTGSRGDAFKGVFAGLAGSLVQRCPSFVVWEVGLSRVGKEGQDGGDFPGRASLAGRDH